MGRRRGWLPGTRVCIDRRDGGRGGRSTVVDWVVRLGTGDGPKLVRVGLWAGECKQRQRKQEVRVCIPGPRQRG